ncbi:deoxyribonuclease-2-beta [Mus pahari]|uniref:deoxyribonuclease-2-beta n=1 Tax=Mus pahari TaxID=10093 RepID=UPI000A30C047|nr:deoxyribonuclease-2-beta [Mus pahari]XP_029393630.1 deoxyribonuclease-2-beta [Mus pahari]
MRAKPLRTALSLLFFALSGVLGAPEISCRNEDGEAVDWFIFYKLPKRTSEASEETGLQYLYLDSTRQTWNKSHNLINSSTSALGRTLQQLYAAHDSKNDTAYLIYNDGVPGSVNYNRQYGHTKGLLVWTRMQGFWLIHSVPKFPPVPERGYDYPTSGRRYGQTGICITFRYSQFEAIDSQVFIVKPNIYSCFIPSTFHWELIHMPQMCANFSSSKIPAQHLTVLQSARGLNFVHFAKSSFYTDDIITAWIAQRLKTHLLAQTWQKKNQELPSNCSLPYHVYNIKAIGETQSYFSSRQDHSKWCVSIKGSANRWTCIGDLNRSPHQALRGGGFICTKNRYIYQAFHKLVLHYGRCK